MAGSSIRFGIRLPPCESPKRIDEFARMAELGGFDSVSVPDSPMVPQWRDVYLTLTLCALATSKMRLIVGMTNPVTRHVSATASAVATLDELAGDSRTILGIGSGYSSVANIGKSKATLKECRDYVTNLRKLLDGESVSFNGKNARLGSPRPVPVYVVASGPKMLRLAAQIADGVMIMFGSAPEYIKDAFRNIDEGLRESGRKREEIKVVGIFDCVLADTMEEARNLARPFVLGFFYSMPHLIRLAGIEFPLTTSPNERNALTSKDLIEMYHTSNWQDASAIAKFVPDEIVEKFSIAGTPEYFVERISEITKTGITDILINSYESHILPTRTVKAFIEEIIPSFRQ